MTKYNEIKMDKKLRSAKLWTENKKQTVFDREGPRDLRASEFDTRGVPRYTLFADEAHVPGACPKATVDFGRDRHSDEAGPT